MSCRNLNLLLNLRPNLKREHLTAFLNHLGHVAEEKRGFKGKHRHKQYSGIIKQSVDEHFILNKIISMIADLSAVCSSSSLPWAAMGGWKRSQHILGETWGKAGGWSISGRTSRFTVNMG